ARFKAFSPPLAGASSAEPAARKPGEAALAASFGTGVKSQLLLMPRTPGAPVVTETDLVELARRAPSASADPYFPLKAFHLFHAVNNVRSSRTWYEQLKTPALLMGLEDLAPTFANVLPESAEAEAKAHFEAAWDLYHKKKDVAGGKKKFLECVQKYAGTDYMRETLPTLGRTRLEVVEGFFGGAPRKALADVFGTAGVRDLGRGRFEVVYTFKDDRELDHFAVGDGGVTARRLDPGPGVRLQTNGVWYWNVPLRGDVLIEATFQMGADGPLGLVVCGEGNRAGYLGILDLPLPGAPPLDGIIKLPLTGPQSMMAQSTSNLASNRGTNVALLQREGTRLRFTVNGGTVEGDNAEVQQGRAGVAIGPAPVVLTRLKIVGEVDSAWLEAEIKRVGESR
ncbi:MAG TPA: hypothetical protein VEJ18_00005, partial [Planctomycetota bacterium]|nr:hypothetical protein [Planctomycetota bacterium]